MKKFIYLLMASILGGVITLGSYTFLNKEKQRNENNSTSITNQTKPAAILTSNNASLKNYLPENAVDFTTSAKKTVDAVVHVKNKSVQTVRDPFAEMMYGRGHGAKQYEQVGTGSGVIISNDGYILTNNHVVKGATELEITLNNKKTYAAKIVGADQKSDIALLKIEEKDLPFLTFGNSDNLKIGEWVLAVGNPFNLTSTVTAGIVSAKGRDLDGNNNIESFIQTDAAVNPGNSGGALVDSNGYLVGINTAIASKTGSFIGYSFAVPSNIAKKVVQDFLEFGHVQRAILGVRGGELNGMNAKDLATELTEGFYVSDVIEDTGAALAGIKSGDIITKLDNIKISTFSDLTGYLKSKEPNEEIIVTVERDGELKEFTVKLTKDDGVREVNLGFKLKSVSQDELDNYGIKKGVKIVEIENPELLRYGVRKGYIITKINDRVVASTEDVQRIIAQKLDNEPIRIEMLNLQGVKERYIFK